MRFFIDIILNDKYNIKSRIKGKIDFSTWLGNKYKLFRSSSVVELSAVNRSVVGSNPTCGAIRGSTQEAEEAPLLRV